MKYIFIISLTIVSSMMPITTRTANDTPGGNESWFSVPNIINSARSTLLGLAMPRTKVEQHLKHGTDLTQEEYDAGTKDILLAIKTNLGPKNYLRRAADIIKSGRQHQLRTKVEDLQALLTLTQESDRINAATRAIVLAELALIHEESGKALEDHLPTAPILKKNRRKKSKQVLEQKDEQDEFEQPSLNAAVDFEGADQPQYLTEQPEPLD